MTAKTQIFLIQEILNNGEGHLETLHINFFFNSQLRNNENVVKTVTKSLKNGT
jgi:hypothetical protein